MKKKSDLTKLGDEGWTIKSSPIVEPDTVFVDEEADLLVFNPVNWNYLAYSDDIMMAHHLNMSRIYARIEEMAEQAEDRLDAMVDYLNHRHDPQIITFLYGTEVTENEDGSYTFFAKGEPIKPTEQGDFVQAMGQESTTYQTLKDGLGHEPTFDELIRGY